MLVCGRNLDIGFMHRAYGNNYFGHNKSAEYLKYPSSPISWGKLEPFQYKLTFEKYIYKQIKILVWTNNLMRWNQCIHLCLNKLSKQIQKLVWTNNLMSSNQCIHFLLNWTHASPIVNYQFHNLHHGKNETNPSEDNKSSESYYTSPTQRNRKPYPEKIDTGKKLHCCLTYRTEQTETQRQKPVITNHIWNWKCLLTLTQNINTQWLCVNIPWN